jgi:hypothetical protein
MGKNDTISSKVRKQTLLSNIVLQFLVTAIRQEEKIKETQTGKEEVKLSIFTADLVLYLKDPENSSEMLLDIINMFSKVAGYKISMQKPVVFLYTNNEKTEKKNIGKQLHLQYIKKMKYQGMNLTKEVKDLYIRR